MAFYVERFRDMETREFDVEVVTPLFLGGSDPQKAELRVPSIKGALRFWWRALYGSDDIKKMKEREDKIFGSTEEKAAFSIYLKDDDRIIPVLKDLPQGMKVMTKSKGRTFPVSIIEYLAYGLCEYRPDVRKNVFIKQHIPAGSRFKLFFSIKNGSESEEVINSLKALTNYGALGSHSRNGFGSIRIEGLSYPLEMKGSLKSFTSLSSKSILFNNFSQKDKWEDALSEIGKIYREARTSLENRHQFNKRQLVAKPIIVKNEVNITDRHSKPYFLHVNKLSNGKYQGQILFMPYRYYDSTKHTEYLAVCDAMNRKIEELCGGNK